MAKTTAPNTIVVVDDEIRHVSWIIDYLESKGFEVKSASSVEDAITLVSEQIYRAIIVDLNVLLSESSELISTSLTKVYKNYPGLYIAFMARNLGYRDRQVIIYSVHKDKAVSEECERIRCSYVLKGRPKELKAEIDAVIAFDPTSEVQ